MDVSGVSKNVDNRRNHKENDRFDYKKLKALLFEGTNTNFKKEKKNLKRKRNHHARYFCTHSLFL